MASELIEKAVKTANWREHRATQVFLTTPAEYEDEPIHLGQRLWLCRALLALTRDEAIRLYDSLVDSYKRDVAEGGDFTSQDVRDRLPHLYASPTADRTWDCVTDRRVAPAFVEGRFSTHANRADKSGGPVRSHKAPLDRRKISPAYRSDGKVWRSHDGADSARNWLPDRRRPPAQSESGEK